jgi:putative peptidoglycan lipid II flippase
MPDNQKSSSNQSRVANAATLVMITVVGSRLLGLLRDMIFSYQFGRSGLTDVYYGAFTLPDALMYLIAGGAISSTFIPVFTDYLQKGDEKEAWKVFSIVLNFVAIIALVLVVICEIFAPTFVHILNPGFDPKRLHLCTQLTRIILPAQFCFLTGSLFMGSLNARNKMLIPGLGPSIYNIGIIIGAILAQPAATGIFGGLNALMWGGLLGAFVGNLLIQAIQSSREGMRYTPSLNWKHPGVIKVGKMMLPILLGISLPNVDQIVMKVTASCLTKGSTSALQLANRMMLMPIGIFAQAVSIAVLPTMARHTSSGDMSEFKRTTGKTLRTILFITIPCSALMFILAAPIIQALYQHGKFNADDTSVTASALRFYCIGIFAWSSQAILTRGFYALKDTITTVVTGSIMTVVFCALNFWAIMTTRGGHLNHFGHWPFLSIDYSLPGSSHLGVDWIALNTSISAIIYMLWLFKILRKRMRGLQDRALTMTLVRIILGTVALSIATGGAVWLWSHALGIRHGGALAAIAQLIVCGSLGIWVYVQVAKFYKLAELDSLTSMLDSKFAPLLSKLRSIANRNQ